MSSKRNLFKWCLCAMGILFVVVEKVHRDKVLREHVGEEVGLQ